MKPGAVYFDTGPVPLFVGLCRSEKDFAREMRRLAIKEPPPFLIPGKPACTHHFAAQHIVTRKMATSLVCVDPVWRPKYLSEFFGILAHEAAHVWQHAQECMAGGHQGNEIEAYAIQWFTQCLFFEFNKGRVLPARGS